MKTLSAVAFTLFWSICGAQQTHRATDHPDLRRDLPHAAELRADEAISSNPALPPQLRSQLMGLMVIELGPTTAESEVASKSATRALIGKTRARLVTISDEPGETVLLQAWDFQTGCGGTGNCPTFIFHKTGGKWEKLLDTMAETIAIRPSSSDGYKEIFVGLHNSATDTEARIYRFTKGRYRRAACFEVDYQGPDLSALIEPTITPCGSR